MSGTVFSPAPLHPTTIRHPLYLRTPITNQVYYEINVPRPLLSSLISEQDGLAKLLEAVLNQILDAQASEQVGAGRYERSEERMAYRNGYRPRQLYTRVGPVTLRVPLMRDGQFSTEIFSHYQRSEQALVLSLMETIIFPV